MANTNVTGSIIGLIAIVPFLAAGVFAGGYLATDTAPKVIGSYKAHLARIEQSVKSTPAVDAEIRAKYGKQLCEDYNNASWISKKFGLKDLQWCEDRT